IHDPVKPFGIDRRQSLSTTLLTQFSAYFFCNFTSVLVTLSNLLINSIRYSITDVASLGSEGFLAKKLLLAPVKVFVGAKLTG
ncbi:hypothetical protein ACR2YZ_27600, partial [Klebsiella pneumoniae]